MENLFLFLFQIRSAWIEIKYLQPYFQFKQLLTNYYGTSKFIKACTNIELYIKENGISAPVSYFR